MTVTIKTKFYQKPEESKDLKLSLCFLDYNMVKYNLIDGDAFVVYIFPRDEFVGNFWKLLSYMQIKGLCLC